MTKTILLASAAAAAVGIAPAVALTDTTFETEDKIIVWGTKVESDLLTLDTDDIALRQADHLSDLLRIVPGVDIGGTHSVNSRINIRGLDDRELSIYIDGALQTNYLYHHIGNLLINSDILKSAEVQVGANSVTDGGIGGVVRFETKSAEDLLEGSDRKVGARLMGSYNSNAKTAFSGTGYAQFTDKVDGLVYFQREDRDNFEDGDGRNTIGSDGTTENLLLKIGFEPTDTQRLQLSYDLLNDEGDYTQRPDMGVLTNQAITGDILLPTEYERETVNASYRLDLGAPFRLDATWYMNDLSLTRDETNPNVRVRGGNTRKRAESDNQGLNIMAVSEVAFGNIEHAFTYGLQYFDQNLTFHPDLDTNAATIKQSAETVAIFVEDSISLGDRLTLRPGLRYTDYEVEYENTGDNGSFSDVTYGIAGEFEVTDSLRLVASFTEIFQGPELAEPFTGAGGNKIVNPDLEEETGDNTEIGFRYATSVGDAEFGLGANYFWTDIDGYIGEIDVPGTTTGETQDSNLGTVEIKGFEASATLGYGPWNFFVTHNQSDFDTDNLNTGSVSESFREVGDTTSYEVSYDWEAASIYVALSGQFIGDKSTSLGADKASYSVHHISARWQEPLGAKGLSVTAGIDNIFDETYTSHASRTGETVHPVFGPLILNDVEPGRNLKITVAKTF